MTGRSTTKPKSTPKAKPVKQKGLIARIRNFILYSALMMLIGGSAEKYKNEILHFVTSGYQPAIERIIDFTHNVYDDFIGKSSTLEKNTEHVKDIDPSNIPTSNELIKHKYYMLGYNENTKQPNWVSYTLTKQMLQNKKYKRTDDFRPDPLVKTGSAELSDYQKSGYDRGHLCPAADMAFNKKAMSETFYLSNMSPQKPDFNRGIWKTLEEKVRTWAVKFDKIYVVTGPIFYKNKKHKKIGSDNVEIPDAFYKVILVYNGSNSQAIGFVLQNKGSNKRLIYFSMPVDNVERITGINFFGFLPDNIEEKVEKVCNYYRWG